MNRATISTDHDEPEVVAAAVRPDNTPQVTTTVDGDAVETTIERETLGGLRATVGDYLRAVEVATETVRLVSETDQVDP